MTPLRGLVIGLTLSAAPLGAAVLHMTPAHAVTQARCGNANVPINPCRLGSWAAKCAASFPTNPCHVS